MVSLMVECGGLYCCDVSVLFQKIEMWCGVVVMVMAMHVLVLMIVGDGQKVQETVMQEQYVMCSLTRVGSTLCFMFVSSRDLYLPMYACSSDGLLRKHGPCPVFPAYTGFCK